LRKKNNHLTQTGNYFQSSLSHKIKLDLNSSKSLEDLPNQKISISLGKKAVKNKKFISEKKIPSPNTAKNQIKPVVLDQQLFKQFKKETFQKIDLHGHTVDEAHKVLSAYLKNNYNKKNLLHIVITGLGNKSDGDGFFTGKIRKQFPLWLETAFFQNLVKSYSPSKIQHGGLGAFYIKLRIKE
jgi:DNA-nicking Smr family endonuclease